MSSSWINLGALWRIIVVGIALGAGLPALFAIGLRALTVGSATGGAAGGEAGADGGGSGGAAAAVSGGLLGRVIAGVCFAAVLAAIGWGIYSIVNQS
jgi:hypothetical protein